MGSLIVQHVPDSDPPAFSVGRLDPPKTTPKPEPESDASEEETSEPPPQTAPKEDTTAKPQGGIDF